MSEEIYYRVGDLVLFRVGDNTRWSRGKVVEIKFNPARLVIETRNQHRVIRRVTNVKKM